jgi:hypothetical protein
MNLATVRIEHTHGDGVFAATAVTRWRIVAKREKCNVAEQMKV